MPLALFFAFTMGYGVPDLDGVIDGFAYYFYLVWYRIVYWWRRGVQSLYESEEAK